jgi:hypothetical protein
VKVISQGSARWQIVRQPDGKVTWRVLVDVGAGQAPSVIGSGDAPSERHARVAIVTVIAEYIVTKRGK